LEGLQFCRREGRGQDQGGGSGSGGGHGVSPWLL
jgi:hypothetical protein